jgi:transposase
MKKIEFNDADKQALNHERYHHPHPRVQIKMETIWLKSLGYSPDQIGEIANISRSTYYNYLKEYVEGGIEKLKEVNFNQPKSDMVKHQATISAYFREHPPTTVKKTMAKIEDLTSIKRGETQTRKFLQKIGLSYLKVGMVPSKAEPDKQDEFKKNQMEPALEKAFTNKQKVYYVDAAHFVLAPFLGYLWSFCRLFIRAPAGRKRFNILGALDAITHQLITVTNDTYINSHSVCELFGLLRLANPELPITVILDNARYQKCQLVFDKAASLNIDLLYLPPYSPNLNIIERIWKFVKKKCLYSKYYSEFDTFKNAISDCLAHTHDTYKKDMDSLLTLNFQSFKKIEKVQVMAA